MTALALVILAALVIRGAVYASAGLLLCMWGVASFPALLKGRLEPRFYDRPSTGFLAMSRRFGGVMIVLRMPTWRLWAMRLKEDCFAWRIAAQIGPFLIYAWPK